MKIENSEIVKCFSALELGLLDGSVNYIVQNYEINLNYDNLWLIHGNLCLRKRLLMELNEDIFGIRAQEERRIMRRNSYFATLPLYACFRVKKDLSLCLSHFSVA